MSDAIFIQSLLDNKVMDVQGAKGAPGTPLDVFSMKFSPGGTPPSTRELSEAANQLWTTVPGPFENSFFLQSSLNPRLVVDVRGGAAIARSTLQVFDKKATGSPHENDAAKNQLWRWVEVEQPGPAGTLRNSFLQLQSLMDSNLVVDVRGDSTSSGATLQVFTKKPTSTTDQFEAAKNQLWSLVPTFVPPPPK